MHGGKIGGMKGKSRARETEGKEVLRGILVGDQANGTKQSKEELIFSRLCIRGVHGLTQIC